MEMIGTALELVSDNRQVMVRPEAVKDEKYRLSSFAAWLDETGGHWAAPDLAAYRDHLLSRGLAPATIKAHLACCAEGTAISATSL